MMLIFLLLLSTSAAELQQEIEQLKKEKSALYLQISDAVEEIQGALAQGDDPSAANHGDWLRSQLRAINGSLNAINDDANNSAVADFAENNNTRRSDKWRPFENEDAFKIGLIYDKVKNLKKRKTRLENRGPMQKKLEQWLLDRDAKRKIIQEYRISRGLGNQKYEHCPRFGIDKKKAKRKRRKKWGGKYPCCRKCCKSSYLGCL